jgi:hypothetical protein
VIATYGRVSPINIYIFVTTELSAASIPEDRLRIANNAGFGVPGR